MNRASQLVLAVGAVGVGFLGWGAYGRRRRDGTSVPADAKRLAVSKAVANDAAASHPVSAADVAAARHARVCGDRTLPVFQVPGRWVWPLATWNGRPPVCSDGWGSPRRSLDGKARIHLGVDLMYRRSSRTDLVDAYPPGTRGGSKWHVMPIDAPALAASGGVVRFARDTERGWTVVIDHIAGWSTYYTHLTMAMVRPGQRVVAGQAVGIVGGDPANRPHLRHLHFALWRGKWQDTAVNPAPLMASWDVLTAPATSFAAA